MGPDPPVFNAGAEATAGKLHGNGKVSPAAPAAAHSAPPAPALPAAADPPVFNAGAEATAGKLHGNGKGPAGALSPPGHRAGMSRGVAAAAAGSIHRRASGGGHGAGRSRRASRMPSHRYGDEYEDPDSLEGSDAEEEVRRQGQAAAGAGACAGELAAP